MGMDFGSQMIPIIVNSIIIIGAVILIIRGFRKRSNNQDLLIQENKELMEENQKLKEKNLDLEKELFQLKNK